MKMMGLGSRHEGDSLALAANNAHELARTLRQLKFDAYVLHTRTSSVVSVGAFNGPTDPEVDRLRRASPPCSSRSPAPKPTRRRRTRWACSRRRCRSRCRTPEK